ncbi:hypothetical protein G9A89_016014 [Geosiphon pyriformis]|nr:hypothetical protein G9A89_016014 [Geosiphon pyriformis]
MVDIEINLDKTETMVVRLSKGKLLMVEPLKFGPDKQILKLLDPSTCIRYLGVWIRADRKNETILKMIGSDIEAEARRAAAFITHGIEAKFGVVIDETLSSMKTEAKAVLLVLKAVPYRCKLTINMDSQVVMATAQR